MASLENVFSWSKSRDEQFRECQRKYFFDKYASWGGWDKNAAEETRLAYILKNLKNRWAWKGESVHHTIEEVLKSLRVEKPLSLEEALARMTETMRANYRSSKAKKNHEDPKRNLGLFEIEYDKPVTDVIWKKIHGEAEDCLRGFYRSDLYKELLSDDKRRWLAIEDLEEFDLTGSRIYVKLDFARKKGDLIEIYDWKTGKDEKTDATVQMGTYAIYAMKKWSAPLSQIRGYIFNLTAPFPIAREEPLSEAMITGTEKIIAESVAQMKSVLADPLKNIPLPRENFRYTENTRFCDSCNFYRLCDNPQIKK